MVPDPHPQPLVRHFRLPTCLAQLASLRAELRALLRDVGLSESAIHDVVLATHEAAVNGMVHGNAGDATRHIEVEVRLQGGCVVVEVTDQGHGFDWRKWVHGGHGRIVPPEAPTGRGILVMTSVMDEVTFSRNGSTVRLRKRIPEAAPPTA